MTEPLAAPARLLWQPATIVAIKTETARVKTFVLTPARPFSFRAGQHVDVRLTAPDGYQAQRLRGRPGGRSWPSTAPRPTRHPGTT